MTEHSFSLVPFPDSKIPEVQITGRIVREENLLSIHYLLSGKIEDIFIAETVNLPGRRNELWATTCFEFFLGIPNEHAYWEFNLSPSGDWNAYRMDAYRRVGFREETRIRQLQLDAMRNSDSLSLAGRVDLSPIVESGMPLQAGVTGVVQARDGYLTYWALVHPGSQADFHAKESFTLLLEGSNRP